MIEVINTGERILLDRETPLMIARHFSAYKFTRDYICDKDILEIGCGEGYGSNYLAGFAKNVVAIDYDDKIINYAKNKYQKKNLQFSAMDAKNLKMLNNEFDIIYSFQFIEHIRDAGAFLMDIKGLLKKDGIFFCSTPNIRDASPGSDKPFNKFHVREYLLHGFRGLLKEYFNTVDIFGLKRSKKLCFYRRLKKIGLFNFLPDSVNPVKRFYNRINCNNFIITKDNIENALDFIAVCKI